jgi:hypothetical protein
VALTDADAGAVAQRDRRPYPDELLRRGESHAGAHYGAAAALYTVADRVGAPGYWTVVEALIRYP